MATDPNGSALADHEQWAENPKSRGSLMRRLHPSSLAPSAAATGCDSPARDTKETRH
jgi:hypothetical protein